VAVGASYRHSAGNGVASITLPALCPKYPGTASVREQVCGAREPKGSRAWEPGLSQTLVYR
jgi:hypothetical protein